MNKAEIVVKKTIEDCGNCPFHEKFIDDGLEDCLNHIDYVCQHEDHNGYKFIEEDVKLLKPIPIPDWCPIKIQI